MAVMVFWYLNYMMWGVNGGVGAAAPNKIKALFLAPSKVQKSLHNLLSSTVCV